MNASKFQLKSFAESHQYQIGAVGEGLIPVYADCVDCGAVTPVMVGGIVTEGQLAVIDSRPGQYRLALFCESCFDARKKG